jgi:hypothetical protein
MNLLDWKMRSTDGLNYEVSSADFFIWFRLSDSYGKFATSQCDGVKVHFNRKRKFFPATATIELESEQIGNIKSWLVWHRIELQGKLYSISPKILKCTLVLRNGEGKPLLEKRMPKLADRGVGRIESSISADENQIAKLVPLLFYAPVLGQSSAILFLVIASLVNVVSIVCLLW